MKAILRFLVTALAVMVSLGTCSALASTGTTPKPEPEVSFSTPEVDFRYQLVGTTSPQISQVVTNSGTAPLVITAMDVTGEDAADFAISSNFTLPVTIPPGQSVTVNVTFAPGEPWTPGTRRATLKFTDTDGPQFVSLTGMGVNCGGRCPQCYRTASAPIRTWTVFYVAEGQGRVREAAINSSQPQKTPSPFGSSRGPTRQRSVQNTSLAVLLGRQGKNGKLFRARSPLLGSRRRDQSTSRYRIGGNWKLFRSQTARFRLM